MAKRFAKTALPRETFPRTAFRSGVAGAELAKLLAPSRGIGLPLRWAPLTHPPGEPWGRAQLVFPHGPMGDAVLACIPLKYSALLSSFVLTNHPCSEPM